MSKLTAVLSVSLSLSSCGFGSDVQIDRTRVDGIDRFHSRVTTRDGATTFECIDSASGRCHYTLYSAPCAEDAGACGTVPQDRFAVSRGQHRRIDAQAGLHVCARADAAPMDAACRSVER